MTDTILRMIIQIRRGTTAEWELRKHVIPEAGEPCMNLDTGVVVYGNGKDTYEALVAAHMEASDVGTLSERISLIESTYLKGADESEFIIDSNRHISIKSISMEKISGLPEALSAIQASENVIESIKIGNFTLPVDEHKSVSIPLATHALAGVVKSSIIENGVVVSEDGTMTVHSLNVNKLTQTEGDTLILDGGSAVK